MCLSWTVGFQSELNDHFFSDESDNFCNKPKACRIGTECALLKKYSTCLKKMFAFTHLMSVT